MSPSDRDHSYLPARQAPHVSRTFLGGMQLGARTGLFLMFGILSLLGFVLLVIHVNDRTASALRAQTLAQGMSASVTEVIRSRSELRALEQRYLQTRDGALSGAMRSSADRMSRALDGLIAHPDAGELDRPLETLRDGLVQYEQHLTGLIQAGDAGGLKREIKNANAALGARLVKAPQGAGLVSLFGGINQAGGEIILTGDPEGMEAVQSGYNALDAQIRRARISDAAKQSILGHLADHERAMLALITLRITQAEEAQRFEDIQAYIALSLKTLTDVSGELLTERAAAVTNATRYAEVTLAGGGAAIVLWTLIIGLVLMYSITRPVQALAGAALGVMRGDRTVLAPGRGNSDAIGYLARAFDDWIGAITDADHLRQDLEHAQAQMEQAVAEAERQAALTADARERTEDLGRALTQARQRIDLADKSEAAVNQEREALRQAVMNTRKREQAVTEASDRKDARIAELEETLKRRESQPAPSTHTAASNGGAPIQALSQRLTDLSSLASKSVVDAERAEMLLKSLDQMTKEVALTTSHVTSLRDQLSMLIMDGEASRRPGEDGFPHLDPHQLPPSIDLTKVGNKRRLAVIRDALGRALNTLRSLEADVRHVNETARTLASSASGGARTATEQLLGQSARLRHLLNQVIRETTPEAALERGPRMADDGSSKT